MPFDSPASQSFGKVAELGGTQTPPLLPCQAAVGAQVSVVNLDVGAGKAGHWGWGERVQTTWAGYTPKVTEKTTSEEGFDFTTSQIHSMRVYGHCWEIDWEGLPFRDAGRRLRVWPWSQARHTL